MISARIRQLLAYGIFTVTLVVASASQGHAFEARIDQFIVIKNGTVFFNDGFGNGIPPPSGVPGFGYLTNGVFAESGGKGIMNSDVGLPTFGRAGFVSFSVDVTNPALRGLTGAPLTFEINSDIPGSTVLLDNIQFPGLANGNFTGGDLSSWVAVGNAGVLVVESPQDAEVDVRRAVVKLGKKGDSFTITGRFITDPAVSDGINLPEDVSVVFNGFSQTIPATSFFRDDDNEGFQFNGTDGGIKHLKIRDDGSFRVMGQKVDLDGTDFADPVPFSLRIGNDLAQTEITVTK